MGSDRVEEYLEAIYKRQNVETPVTTSGLAKDLGVSLPAVTDMLRRLESEGLIQYVSNKGATLTEEGTGKAVSVVRRHRLWERFLTDILGFKWDKVHDEACRLEHATSPETEKRLSSLLGDVDTCPHGQPIPDEKGNVKEQTIMPLTEFSPGQSACIMTIAEETPRLLREIDKLGLKPQTSVTIIDKNDNNIELEVNGKHLRIKKAIATLLLAKPASSDEKNSATEELSLNDLKKGDTGIIKSYVGGRAMLGRCLSMGFTPGSTVKMQENFNSGPVLVRIHDTEVALGRGVAGKIIVTRNK